MLINELPDDCLLNIFDYIQDLEDLINCFKVCEKWSTLIVDRTKNVKYFIEQPNYSPDSVCYQSDEPFDVTFLCKWFPNLRIVDFCTCNGIMSTADTAKLIRDSESLKGTIVDDFFFWVYTAELERIMMNANLEMLSTEHLYFDRSEINENVKQLYLPNRIFLPKDVAHIFPNLERLHIRCLAFCEKWRNLITVRTKKVKYVIEQPNYSPDSVCHQSDAPFDLTFVCKWFPNIRIFDFLTCKRMAPENVADEINRDLESLKGIIADDWFFWSCAMDLKTNRPLMNANLEMLSTLDMNFENVVENIKQLHLSNSSLVLPKKVTHCFPNLERLNISLADDYSNGPVMTNLKIIELRLVSAGWDGPCRIFEVMDSCPALQSAHIINEDDHFTIDDSIKNANLQDLVLQFLEPKGWYKLPRCMSKYPNLKHLAIRNAYLSDEDIKKLVLILPKLTLLDIRESHGVTQEAADHVKVYCKQHGRSIKFYFKADDKQIQSDWPQILNRPEKICRGFDFMEHCFFKSFDNLPYLLDPIDD
ncbi:uncharacterized protein LOC112538679 isoform X2 [Tetranychus urticae]|uniref:uncharacterized protein LOC112538679 isoform X2 n=1 Tax=Tetranychus urticae TaxID=32264 RepID=UPI000D655687|nr:uncharacterized protein LOC112538679 isoform X2 [Tetranychus urticae]